MRSFSISEYEAAADMLEEESRMFSSASTTWFIVLLYMFYNPSRAQNNIFGKNKYTEYQIGNMSLIITVPHGGSLQPSSIPSRDSGCWDKATSECYYTHSCPPGTAKDSTKCSVSTVKDLYTLETAQALAKEISLLSGGYTPHVIINHLSRSKLDVNREKDEAAFGNSEAEQAFDEFMEFINMAKSQIQKGLLIDIHGQAHPEQWIELGYLLSKANLDSGAFTASGTSIFSMSKELYNIPFETLLRGEKSLGKYIQDQNPKYVCVPSPTNLGPNGGNYFSGGYIVKTHGSKVSGSVDAVQIELPRWIRESSERPSFCVALAKAISHFYELSFN
ncbi:uncharacterized protein LOC108700207 isoform X1 [Xenopus laevis]|uniref:Uncharacterized protein LOC108700207 isoform X1 n=1 Tax=Xenopus laevis TaxID=8355 RepID=A0A8J0TQX6_XENLA|nr:uncharacterized protein LOC108700207 isoform X1 [Xenopus laevis]